MNYRGDPHDQPYPIYSAGAEGDAFGMNRLVWMCDKVKPDVIVLQNDGWNIPQYIRQLRMKLPNGEYAWPEYAAIPVIGAIACDGKNFVGKWIDGISHAIFWTKFALDEARAGGYKGPATVIPLGVDLTTFYPEDRGEARQRVLGKILDDDVFIVGCVNRNQPRKRWDLLIRYFATWLNRECLKDVYLFLHTAPTGDNAIDVNALARYYGILDRVAVRQPSVWHGNTEEEMRDFYNCLDVAATTTQGEGWGLTTMEAMACGVPCIAPDWSALGEWAADAAVMVPCTSTAVTYGNPSPGVLGGIADEEEFIKTLDMMYRTPEQRELHRQRGLELVAEDRFQWKTIQQQYDDVVTSVLASQTIGV